MEKKMYVLQRLRILSILFLSILFYLLYSCSSEIKTNPSESSKNSVAYDSTNSLSNYYKYSLGKSDSLRIDIQDGFQNDNLVILFDNDTMYNKNIVSGVSSGVADIIKLPKNLKYKQLKVIVNKSKILSTKLFFNYDCIAINYLFTTITILYTNAILFYE